MTDKDDVLILRNMHNLIITLLIKKLIILVIVITTKIIIIIKKNTKCQRSCWPSQRGEKKKKELVKSSHPTNGVTLEPLTLPPPNPYVLFYAGVYHSM